MKMLCFLLFVHVLFLTGVESSNPNWSLLSGRLKQLDLSPYNILWGVNSGHAIWVRKGSGWTRVGGALKHVSVGNGGVWGVNKHDNIYFREGVTFSSPVGTSWTQISGSLKRILKRTTGEDGVKQSSPCRILNYNYIMKDDRQ
ncbi:lectin L6-like [Xenia sp. Carnegie-2017]|uniref:lectin L6-like n=1 Tax=Xenia sp. Carnegie-2017 TaxID=2897299 RepID=UPI001F044C10|nr:lectin L6-like [Xenia sp. Carnegie-2017]XP_046861570.1 lectin L6-like [Xenia sp. Carnegie-2017]